MKLLLFKIVLLCLMCLYKSDIPVHCLKSQIEGEWEFKATEPTTKAMNEFYQMTCGHVNPSHESTAYKINMDMNLFSEKFTLNLQQNFSAELKQNDKVKKGEWTMVYDEGFDFSFGQKGSKDFSTYFVFSKYGPNDFKNEKIKSKWTSNCYATLIGWYQVGDKYGCFIGTKKGQDADEITNGEAANKQVVVEGSMKEKTFLQTNENKKEEYRFMQSKFGEKLLLTADFKDHAKVVERINASNATWKAAAYSLFEGKTIEELNKMAGRKKSRNGNFADFNFSENKNSHKTKTHKSKIETKKGKKAFIKNKVNKDSKLPETFSWKDFMGPVKSQGPCGSCFAVSTISMLEARYKIKYEEKLKKYYTDLNDFKISIPHVLQCSFYNQGCDGGYSYLVSKFFYQFEVYPDKCFDEKAKTCQQTCKDSKLRDLKLSVKDFYYVGGAYGKTNEENLMRDLYENGPIVISMEPEYSFMIYKNGIYDFNKSTWLKQNISKPQWQKVDHSVVLVGWGTEIANGQEIKYWLLQNSWGNKWGEEGYMRFKRGIDLMGIESIGEAAIPFIK